MNISTLSSRTSTFTVVLLATLAIICIGTQSVRATSSKGFGGNPITINDDATATAYPSTIPVSGITGTDTVTSVRVALNGFSHTNPDDVDIFLVAPDGSISVLLSDAGGTHPVTDVDLVFDDAAAIDIPDTPVTPLTSGSYRPANYLPGEALPPGAAGVIGTSLTALGATGTTGDWKLYVTDDAGGNSGSITSWKLWIDSRPKTEFAATGSLATGRISPTATLLPSGKVLVAGGSDGSSGAPKGSSATRGAELYDPATGTWSATGDFTTARWDHTATLLPSGKALVAGGWGGAGISTSAELYDPAKATWIATGSLANARIRHTATLLPNGKVLVAGGYNGSAISNAELYDPATSSWSPTGDLTAARRDHTATLLPSGKILVVGGMDDSSRARLRLSSAELYDPATGTWSATGSLANARYAHTATLLPNGKLLVVGGIGDNSGTPSSAELYDPATGTWSATGSLANARRSHPATLLPSGKVLVAGGYGNRGIFPSAELYDPATGSWSPTGDLLNARGSHTATLLPSGKILVAGGYGGSIRHCTSTELYDPATRQ